MISFFEEELPMNQNVLGVTSNAFCFSAHDRFTARPRTHGLAHCARSAAPLLVAEISSRFHSASAFRHPRLAPLLEDQAARHDRHPGGMAGLAPGTGPRKSAALLHPLLCGKAPF